MIAMLSSVALKKGYLPLSILKNMIPVLQISTAFHVKMIIIRYDYISDF